MPAQPQKGTGKKGGSRDQVRRSRSRNTTPSGSSLPPSVSSASLATGTTALLNLPVSSFRTLENALEIHGSTIPGHRELEALLNQLTELTEVVDIREEVHNKGMRLMAKERKERVAELEEIEGERREKEGREEVEREREREKDRDREREKERGVKKGDKGEKKKKREGESSNARGREKEREIKQEKDRPLTHGAHGLAPQDGSGFDTSTPSKDKKPPRRPSRDIDSTSSSLSPAPAVTTPAAAGNDDKDDDDSSMDEHQPAPAPAVPHMQIFGDDPSTFPDPTRYDIPPITDDMTDEEKKEILSVAVFPKHSLDDMIPGPTPDMDYSNAKPTNQVQFNTFSTYIDPYFRQFTEEDLAFLRERGDRVAPFVISRRGKRHYTEIWAEEDGQAISVDGPQTGREKLPFNQPRGSIDQMDDNIAETNDISAGPVLSRLLATLRPEHRAPAEEKPILNGFANGESSLNGEANGDSEPTLPVSDEPAPLPPATQMPGSNEESWRKATHPKLDYAQVDERIKQELRHIGFLMPDAEPDYDAHYDDETAQRLRVLQEMLKARAIKNGAMKARLMDLTREQMAHQEFNTILEDLDDQVKGAYLKRNRTLGKSKKAKKPGGAGGGSHFAAGEKGGAVGMARPGLGDVTKGIMEKRRRWIDTIGTVLDPEAGKVRRANDEGSGIFEEGVMREYERKEMEAWDEGGDEE